MTPLAANMLGLTTAGIATLFVPFCSTYSLLAAYCIVWGGSIGEFLLKEIDPDFNIESVLV